MHSFDEDEPEQCVQEQPLVDPHHSNNIITTTTIIIYNNSRWVGGSLRCFVIVCWTGYETPQNEEVKSSSFVVLRTFSIDFGGTLGFRIGPFLPTCLTENEDSPSKARDVRTLSNTTYGITKHSKM